MHLVHVILSPLALQHQLLVLLDSHGQLVPVNTVDITLAVEFQVILDSSEPSTHI